MKIEDARHYPYTHELTDYQKTNIQLLRERCWDELSRSPHHDSDFNLLRWLIGWDYDIDAIEPRLNRALSTFRLLNPHIKEFEDADDVNVYTVSLNKCCEYFPGGLMGFDREGDLVYVQSVSKVHPRSIVRADSVSELYRVIISEIEAILLLMRKQERALQKKIGVKLVIDCHGFNYDLLYTPAMKIYSNLLSLMQEVSPDFGKVIYVVNAPSMISMAYQMISPVLSRQTRKKVQFLGANWNERLNEEIGEENILPHWGGLKKAKNGKETGTIRMGGKVPEDKWYKNDHFDQDSEMKKVSVSAGCIQEIRVPVEGGRWLRWIWRVSSGDILFHVRHGEQLVFPRLRLSSEFVPEYGRVWCPSDGEYVFVFDNCHAKFFSKEIKHRIELE